MQIKKTGKNNKLNVGCLFRIQFLPITLLESIRSSFILHLVEISDVESDHAHTNFDLILIEPSFLQRFKRFNKEGLSNNMKIPLFLLLRENGTIPVKLLLHPLVSKTIIIQQYQMNLGAIIKKTYLDMVEGHQIENSKVLGGNRKIPLKISEFLAQVNTVIEANSEMNCISVENIANELLMSNIAFRRKIKQITGMTAVQYILYHRLQMARNYLDNKMCTVQEAALKTGFLSNSYFSKSFKNTYGISPSNYLKSET